MNGSQEDSLTRQAASGDTPAFSASEEETLQITMWLQKASAGDVDAQDHVLRLVEHRLKAIARSKLGKNDGRTLQASMVLYDVWGKLLKDKQIAWKDREHFCALACKAVKEVLADYAKKKHAKKRNEGVAPVPFNEELDGLNVQADAIEPIDMLALDDAVNRLAESHEELSGVFEKRYYGGMSNAEVAEFLKKDPGHIRRQYKKAVGMLRLYLSEDDD